MARAADRTWYNHPGQLMIAYLILAAAGGVFRSVVALRTGHPVQQAGPDPVVGLTLIWCWRVARGGHWSRLLLILTSMAEIGSATAHLATRWGVQDASVLVISAAQLALLLSPAAYMATRQDMARQFRRTGQWLVPVAGGGRQLPWAEPARTALTLRLRPPWWLLPVALGAGLLLTLAWLQHPTFMVLPHCGPRHLPPAGQPPARCVVDGTGYPLPVRLFAPNPHWHARVALVKDYVEWTVASLAILHGGRLYWHSRPVYLPAAEPEPSAPPAA